MRSAIFCILLSGVAASVCAAPANYAGSLIDQAMRRHPEIKAVTIRSNKGGQVNLAASNVLEHGAPLTGEEAQVIAGGKPIQVHAGDPSETTSIVPLVDVSGDLVGVLSVTESAAGKPDAAVLSNAFQIRDEMRRQIVNASNLTDPIPYVPNPPAAPYAQQLVDRLMTAHPELLVLAFHVAALQGEDYPIIASSIGRIGKKADEDDMRVIHTQTPAEGAYGANKTRYGIELPMYDARGTLIGAASLGYRYKEGDDRAALMAKARALEAEMRAQIPSLARLYGPAL